jgi:hypothetical protein
VHAQDPKHASPGQRVHHSRLNRRQLRSRFMLQPAASPHSRSHNVSAEALWSQAAAGSGQKHWHQVCPPAPYGPADARASLAAASRCAAAQLVWRPLQLQHTRWHPCTSEQQTAACQCVEWFLDLAAGRCRNNKHLLCAINTKLLPVAAAVVPAAAASTMLHGKCECQSRRYSNITSGTSQQRLCIMPCHTTVLQRCT